MSESDSDSDRSSIALAFIATSSNRLPDAGKLVALCGAEPERRGFFASLFGKKKAAQEPPKWGDGHLVLNTQAGMLAVALMPAPIPWSDLEGPCATAWWWPEAAAKMKKHKCHLMFTLMGGELDPVDRRVLLTKLVATALPDCDAVGVYWGEGTIVHAPATFIKYAESIDSENIPGTLWIDVRIEKNPNKTLRCFTTGLAPLGFREIEVKESSLEPGELMEFIGNTACYIANNRLQIKDGETMGRTAEERYKVVYAKSMFDRPPVMRLVMT